MYIERARNVPGSSGEPIFSDPGGEDWSQVGNMDGIGHKSVLKRLLESGPGGKGLDNNS